jgi:hypothetical protein
MSLEADSTLGTEYPGTVLQIFIQTVFSSLRRRAKKYCGIRNSKCGGVTFVPRFGGSNNLNLRFHRLVMDCVYYEGLAEDSVEIG